MHDPWQGFATALSEIAHSRLRREPFQYRISRQKKGGTAMDARTDEVAERIYRISIFVPEIAAPSGFTFNHFLIIDDAPLLFHCGLRKMFPLVSAAVARLMPLERLRWLTFG